MRICWFARLCEPDCVPSEAPTYDGLIVSWTGYTHIPTRVRRVAFLKALRQRALPQSPLLISFLARRSASRDEALVYRMANSSGLFSHGRRERLGAWGSSQLRPVLAF